MSNNKKIVWLVGVIIIVGAVFQFTQSDNPLTESHGSADIAQTAGWDTYTADGSNFEFKYPAEILSTKTVIHPNTGMPQKTTWGWESVVTLVDKGSGIHMLQVHQFEGSAKDAISAKQSNVGGDRILSTKDVALGQASAKEVLWVTPSISESAVQTKEYYFEQGGKAIIVSASTENLMALKGEGNFESILSTVTW